jgi:hypothetical protein
MSWKTQNSCSSSASHKYEHGCCYINWNKTTRKPRLSHNLRVHGSPSWELPRLTLTSTDAVRNLGCYFDRHVQLDRLVSSYCSSAYYHLRLISRIRHLLKRDACHSSIRCLVLSRLDYCNGLLGGLNNGLTNRLQRAQHSAARVINRVRRRCHITTILRLLHWLPIKMRVTFKICTCMYKILHCLTPDYLNCAIARKAHTRALRSASDATLFPVTVPRRTVGKYSFAAARPTIWNSLPKSVRTTETLAAFRKQLKTHLFRLHYLPRWHWFVFYDAAWFLTVRFEIVFYTLIYCFIIIYLSLFI